MTWSTKSARAGTRLPAGGKRVATAADTDGLRHVLLTASRLFRLPVAALTAPAVGSADRHRSRARHASVLVAYEHTTLTHERLSHAFGYGASAASTRAGGTCRIVYDTRWRISDPSKGPLPKTTRAKRDPELARYVRALRRAVADTDPTRCPWCEQPMRGRR